MTAGIFRFGEFLLDPIDRRLARGGVPVQLNARYFDALVLLVRDAGTLVSKDRFLGEVWQGIPVTDEALTQCIKTLRRLLGDDAARPRFIATVPKHGYRFVCAVEHGDEAGIAAMPMCDPSAQWPWRRILLLAGAGTIGAGLAGIVGGLGYGFAAAADAGSGGLSMVSVVLWLTMAMALTGGAGVSLGIAAADIASARWWRIGGGAVGGLMVGGIVKLLGLDAFNLLFGRSPAGITGGVEGLLLGGAVGVGAWFADRGAAHRPLRRTIAIAMIAGTGGGVLIASLGRPMMGGSLDLLAGTFAGSRLHLEPIGRLFGERAFGPVSQAVMSGIEGALFGGGIVGAMALARRRLGVTPLRRGA